MSSSSPSAPSILSGRTVKLLAMLVLSLSLGACDFVSSFTKPKQTPEEAKAEGIALGAGCRLAGQSLEDCYQRNPNSLKSGIFSGWKDMHEYMAAKNIPTAATMPPPAPEAADTPKDADPDAGKDERTLRREKRERERAERENKSNSDSSSGSSRNKSSDSSKSKDSDSPRKSRDDGSSKK